MNTTAGFNSYNTIAEELEKAIENGDYNAGTFPSSRTLAIQYGVSRSTILAAFGILSRKGLMTVSHGKAPNISFEPFEPDETAHSTAELGSAELSENSPLYQKLSSDIPARKWFALISNQARKAHNQGTMPTTDSILELKLALRNYFARQRQIRANLDQIFIFENLTAAMQALANIFAVKAETEILIDAPCLASNVRQFSRFSNKIEAINIDTLVPNQTSEANYNNNNNHKSSLLYTTPSSRLASNRSLNRAARQALVDWAKNNSTYIIEHDRGHEFCSGLSTHPAIFAIDQTSTSVYLADFHSSLSLLTNLCVLIVPPSLANLAKRNHSFEQSSSTIFESIALTTMINSGYLERHARKVGQLSIQSLTELKRLLNENEMSQSIAALKLVKSSKEAILEIAPGINCDFLAPAIACKLLTPTSKIFGFDQCAASTFIVAADFLNQTSRSLLHACFAQRNSKIEEANGKVPNDCSNELNNDFYKGSLLAESILKPFK